MKRILFLFTASLLLLACSNDDNNVPDGPQELQIKKFSQDFHFNQSTDNYTLERLFDETGQTVRESTIHSPITLYWLYSYNSLGVISEKNNFYEDGSKNRIDAFNYDTNNNIENISFKNGLGEVISLRDYTIEADKITFQQSSIYGEIYYNAEGKIIVNYISGDTGSSTQTIEYVGDNITNITKTLSNGNIETYTYQYDDGINPLYNCVQNNYFNATIGDHNSLFNRPNYFSKNNYTQISYTTNAPDSSYVKTKKTVYNSDGYPTSAVVKKNDVHIEELTYEYY